MKNQAHCCSPPHKVKHDFHHHLMTISFYVMIFKFKIKNFFRELFK